jgi:hypothetical protein
MSSSSGSDTKECPSAWKPSRPGRSAAATATRF